MTIPPNEAQFIETRKFQVSEIARAFGVPPHLIGDLDKATFSNIEHQAIEFAQYSLQPWMTQIEQAINAKCLSGAGDEYLFVEHVSEALVKTDILTRYQAHQIAILTGFETPNEARVIENKNPLPGGDVLLQPLNMAPMGSNDNDSGAKAQRSKEGQLPDTETWRGGDTENYNSPRPSSVESGQEGSEASGCWRRWCEIVRSGWLGGSLRTGGGDVRGLRASWLTLCVRCSLRLRGRWVETLARRGGGWGRTR